MANKKDLSAALSQRKSVPPLQRGKGIQLSNDSAEAQESNNTASQFRKDAECDVVQFSGNAKMLESSKVSLQSSEINEKQDSSPVLEQSSEKTPVQNSGDTIEQESEITEQQLKELAKMLQKVMAKEQIEEKTKPRKEDSADLLIRSLAEVQSSIPEVEQFRKLAEMQKKKVNQGVTIPESLFTIYKSCASSLTIRGKKTTMGDLMAKALIKYLVEEIVPELEEE